MDTTWWIVIAVAAAIVLVALAAWAYTQSRRRSALQDQFGPEYDRTVDSAGSRRKAERELAEREKAHEELEIQPLSEAARSRYMDDWQRAEQRFVDDPELAAREADSIVRGVLTERGYPDDDFDTQAAAVSVDHPQVVSRYRHGHEMIHGNGASGCRADREPSQGDGRLPLRLRAAGRAPSARRSSARGTHGRRLGAGTRPGRRYSSPSRGCSSVG